jgi:DNA-directed RNA polymerase subunit M/transcription elongation factor TFIIS
MSGAVICTGCGQPLAIPAGYTRNKIQCPGCGVICPLSEQARQSAGAAPAARTSKKPAIEEDIRWDLIDDSTPAGVPAAPQEPPSLSEEPAPPSAAPEKPTAKGLMFSCRRCGQKVRRQGECPHCDGFAGENAPSTAPSGEPILRLSLDDELSGEDEEDNGNPYTVTGADERRCPECTKVMAADAIVCVACGYHLKKRRKIAKTYDPIDRQWETNYPLGVRLILFGLIAISTLVSGILGVVVAAGLPAFGFFLTWLYFNGTIAFLLGTFDRIRITRDRRGRVQLTKSWRLCFVPARETVLDVQGYGGITAGSYSEVSVWEWMIFLQLLIMLIIPGGIWWYLVIHKLIWRVALTQDHGYSAYLVYQGRSEVQMKEISHTLAAATGLTLEGA